MCVPVCYIDEKFRSMEMVGCQLEIVLPKTDAYVWETKICKTVYTIFYLFIYDALFVQNHFQTSGISRLSLSLRI